MAITKKPTIPASTPTLDKFIQSAPDGIRATGEENDSVQITLRMSREQLNRLTKVAERQGIARAGYIKRAVFIQLEADEKS